MQDNKIVGLGTSLTEMGNKVIAFYYSGLIQTETSIQRLAKMVGPIPILEAFGILQKRFL